MLLDFLNWNWGSSQDRENHGQAQKPVCFSTKHAGLFYTAEEEQIIEPFKHKSNQQSFRRRSVIWKDQVKAQI